MCCKTYRQANVFLRLTPKGYNIPLIAKAWLVRRPVVLEAERTMKTHWLENHILWDLASRAIPEESLGFTAPTNPFFNGS